MIPTAFIQIALVSTSATIALVLGIAWREFDRPRHVFTWSAAFALSALMWSAGLLPRIVPHQEVLVRLTSYLLAGCASVLNTVGFRQRAGVREGRKRLAWTLAAYAAIEAGLIVAHAPSPAALLPINLLNGVMFYRAAETLQGRRKGERAAERVAESGLLLLTLFSAAVSVGLAAAMAGMSQLDMAQLQALTLLALPGIVAGIGLFTIILLAADLADQARRLAATDMLTGLLNRRGFDDTARALIDSARRYHRALTLALMDVDRFKQVNDRFGHPTGDRVLCSIADCVSETLGRRDVLARIGGEEFAIILVDADIVTASITLDTMRRNVAALELGLAPSFRVTASFGAAALHEGESDVTQLTRRADEALYRSKAEGRNRLTVA